MKESKSFIRRLGGAVVTFLKRMLWLLLAVVLFAIGLLVSGVGFDRIEHLRMIERVPRTSIRAAIPGEANLQGIVSAHEGLYVSGPDSRARCLYYEYTEERRTTDSDGHTQWETVRSTKDHVPFVLRDQTGSLVVRPTGVERTTFPRRHRRRQGDRRHTEHRLETGMSVFTMGLAREEGDQLTLWFEGPGSYLPIISTAGEVEERGMVGLASLLFTVLGLTFLSLAMFAFTRCVGLYQTLPYLLLVALTIAGGMVVHAYTMMRSDLRTAFERLERERVTRVQTMCGVLGEVGVEWDGDFHELGEWLRDGRRPFPEAVRERLQEHRINMARSIQRVERLRSLAPERWVARLEGYDSPEQFELLDEELEQLSGLEMQFGISRISGLAASIMAGGGLGLAVLFGSLGMLFIRRKRWIENIPTVTTKGVVYGINELKGEVALASGTSPLAAPLSGQPCACYHYVVQEQRQHGKQATWETITDERREIPFLLRDDEGVLEVRPEGAHTLLKTKTTRRRGRQRHIERRLPLGAYVYALGSAIVCPETHDRLVLARGEEKHLPFLLSDYREEELIARKAKTGFVLLNLGFNAFMLAAFSYAGYRGGFHAFSYLAAALAPLAYWILFMWIIHFNDLVFLRRRCDAMWANIDVALKKRFDLLPQLVNTAKAYLGHERKVQDALAQLRTSGSALTPDEAKHMVEAETGARQRIRLLAEKHPDLQGSAVMADLASRLRMLEDDIAFMRAGYNKAVELYNTRIERLPDVLLARLFSFSARDFFQTGDVEPVALQFSGAPDVESQ